MRSEPDDEQPGEAPWLRLDARMLWVAAARGVLSIFPIVLALTLFGADLDSGVRAALVAAVGIGLAGAVSDAYRWLTARYRVTAERVELRTGRLTRSGKWVPRDRVRTVNVKARPLHRLFGLATVTIGTGESRGTSERAGLALDAIRASEAERLRAALLERSAVAAGPAAAPRAGTDRAPAPTGSPAVLASFRWRYLGYELLAWWTLIVPALGAGAVFQALNTAGVEPERTDLAGSVADAVESAPLALMVVGIPLALIALGAAVAFAYSVERWWGYRLERRSEGGRTLVVRHGLLTRRSKDLEERRLRGVEILETPLLRLANGAIVNAVISGLAQAGGGPGESPKALGPSMARSEAGSVAAAVLAEREDPTAPDGLRPHPPAARRRRFLRSLAAALAAGLACSGLLAVIASGEIDAPAILAIGLVAAALASAAGIALAADSYRALGNCLTGRFLVARHGLLQRRTVALERERIIGWKLRRTIFQRRAGLITLTATTAAGRGAYSAPDMAAPEAVSLANRAVPGLMTPFLARDSRNAPP